MVVIVSSASGFAAVFFDYETLSQSELEIDDIVNDFEARDFETIGFGHLCWQSFAMSRNIKTAAAADEEELAPITTMMSSRLMVLANLLKRGAILRYRRLAGLSSVEFGLVASLGRRPPMSVATLADAVGMDKGQISRALAGLVSRRLVSRAVNPSDNREVLVSLTRTGLTAHDAIVAGAMERNQRLLDGLGEEEVAALLAQIERLTARAADMLAAEKDLMS
jgi:DNA-binding MarR family transcriptional regulator